MNTGSTHLKAMDGFHQDLSELSCRLGDDMSAASFVDSVRLDQVKDTVSFMRFAQQYVEHLLVPIELPGIVAAATLSSKNALRELLELDVQMSQEPLMKLFAQSSRTLGRDQLRKLRGLRDVRVLSRYRAAVLDGDAYGWHLIVYGMVLHQFSIPLRQGLAKYQLQILTGFGRSACQSLQWSESDWLKVRQALENIPTPSLESLVSQPEATGPKLSIL